MSQSIRSLALMAANKMHRLETCKGMLIEDISPGLTDFLFESVDIESVAGINLVLIKLDELESETA